MIKDSYYKSLITLALCAVMCLPMVGCEEEQLYTLSQEDELERWVLESEQGRELFRVHHFVVDEAYSYPNNDTIYTDFLDSSSRNILVRASDDSLINTGVGTYFYATIEVTDNFYGHTQKQAGSQTLSEDFLAHVLRRAFLIKLGDNSQAFAGWVLYGYDGGWSVPAVKVITGDADTMAVNYLQDLVINNYTFDDFMDVNDIFLVPKASSLIVEGCYYSTMVANCEAQGGFAATGLIHPHTGTTCVTDTLVLPSTTNRFWNTLLLRSYEAVDSTGVYYNLSYVPFKIQL